MCMIVKADKDKLMTAEKPVKCYKKVWIHWENGKIYFSSDIKSFKYELGKTYRLSDELDGEVLNRFLSPGHENDDKNWLVVEEGFHSYITLERAMQHYNGTLPYAILECEIPEGSHYRIGTDTHLSDQDMYGDPGGLRNNISRYICSIKSEKLWKIILEKIRKKIP